MKKLVTGIRRHPKKFAVALLFGYTSLWTILEPVFSILCPKVESYSWQYLTSYGAISLIVALIVVYPKRQTTFGLKNTNTKVDIFFGDLFSQEGHKVISASEFFDSKIGKPVAPKSLQGIFIEKVLGGHVNIFDDAVSAQLVGKEIGTVQRVDGKHVKYNIGSTVTIEHSGSIYFIVALATTDFDCNAHCTPSLMLQALEGLWNKVRVEGNGVDINIPLIGNGLARIGLPPTQLVQLILISLLKASKERDLSCNVRIVLTEEIFDKIDIEAINNNWQ